MSIHCQTEQHKFIDPSFALCTENAEDKHGMAKENKIKITKCVYCVCEFDFVCGNVC